MSSGLLVVMLRVLALAAWNRPTPRATCSVSAPSSTLFVRSSRSVTDGDAGHGLALHEETVGKDLDGVIGVVPFALAALVEMTWAIEVSVILDVATDESVDVFANEAYDALGTDDKRQALLGAIAVSSFHHLVEGADGGDVDALADAAAGKRLLLYIAHPDDQVQLSAQPVAGAVAPAPAGTDFLDLTLALRDDTPSSSLLSHTDGLNADELEAGDNRLLVSIYCARDRDLESFTRSLGDGWLAEDTEIDCKLSSSRVRLASAEEKRLTTRRQVSDAWTAEGEDGRSRLRFQGQPTLRAVDESNHASSARVQVHLLCVSPSRSEGPSDADPNRERTVAEG